MGLASRGMRNLMNTTARLERTRPRQRRIPNLVALFLAAVILYAFAGREIRLLGVRSQERELEEAIRAQEIKNQILREQLAILESDEFIEKTAREQLGWIRAGEIQYLPEGAR